MASQTEDYMGRPLYAYDLPPQLLRSITLKPNVDTFATAPSLVPERPSSPSVKDSDSTATETNTVGSLSCSLCGLAFTNVLDQRGHLKSDLHNYNLKQKLRGKKPVSETEFEKLIEDLDESLSGSDSDDDDDDDEEDANDTTLTALLKRQAKIAGKSASSHDDDDGETKVQKSGKTPLLWFSSPLLPENHFFGVYRALFTNEQQKTTDFTEELRKKQLDPITIPHPAKDGTLAPIAYKGPHIFLCMIGGGHFAAMVVSLAPRQSKHNAPMNREATVLAHKTFHRYTTRRKQGGSQSANDNAKGAAHSAGSTLRRYNEQALVEDVRELLHDWKALLATSELMFIRATGITNRRTLYEPYDNQVLRHTDPRIRGFPFNTRRPTQKELMRCFIELTRLKVREIDPASEVKPEKTKPVSSTPATPKPSKPKLTEAAQTALLHTTQLQAFIRRSKLPALLSYLSSNKLSADFAFEPAESHHHTPHPLHLAASQNSAPMVLGLLVRGEANPLLRNAEGKTPFELAGDRATRDAFRVARAELGEARWDWEAAGVPAALSKAEADKRTRREQDEADAKEAERRRAEEERLKTEGPRVPESKRQGGRGGGQVLGGGASALLPKTAQERREEEARGLTPEMRLRLDRERRARAAEERLKRLQGK